MENFHAVKILIEIIRTMARQDITFCGGGNLEVNGNFNQIVMLMAPHCSPLRRWLDNRNGRTNSVTYLSSDSQNEMISLLGDAVRKKVITEVKDAGMYGLSADTTPDLSRHDQLAVVIRYVKETGPIEWLL